MSGRAADVAIALARQIGSDRAAADAALEVLIEKHAAFAYEIAEIYALRNEAKETFVWLDRAFSERDPSVSNLLFEPFIARYKRDPGFATLCRKVGLLTPAETEARK